ncbi:hypothetical protein ACFVQB_14020 [Paenibacillus sp. NPDC057886]|uniref:hypothetical protein n=1 Tax=Paenibacillus sp. NPDC057886 TaxID=3346270 RepID=UPI0036A0DB0F
MSLDFSRFSFDFKQEIDKEMTLLQANLEYQQKYDKVLSQKRLSFIEKKKRANQLLLVEVGEVLERVLRNYHNELKRINTPRN